MRSTKSNAANTTCLACGAQYYHCKTCEKYKAINFWRSNACCPEHFKIFMIAHEYAQHEIDVDTAKEMLGQTKYGDILSCDTDVAEIIKKILKESRKKNAKAQDSEDNQ